MNIFITGISGFMGSHLANYLWAQGHIVTGIDNGFHSCSNKLDKPWCAFNKDIRDTEWLAKYFNSVDVDIIIHLAAQIHVDYSIKYPQETIEINMVGTANLLEEAVKHDIRFINASTSEIYGSSQADYMDESHPLDAQSPYGAAKVGADRLVKSYNDTYGLDGIIIRNFNAFGPYQNDGSYGSVIARFAKAAFNNEPLYIYGDGTQERDYMYIDDIIKAYEYAIDHLSAGVYNFGTGETVTIKELAEAIVELTNSSSEIIHIEDRAGEVQRLCCDITKVRSYGWEPETVFYRDLKKYLDWYNDKN